MTFTLGIYDENGTHWTETFVLSIGPPIPYLTCLDTTADDGVVSPGDTVSLDMEIFNAGSASASGVTAVISTDDPLVTIAGNSQNYWSISANDTKNKNGAFTFDIDPSHPAGETINFTVYLNETDEHYVDNFKIAVFPTNTTVIKVAMLKSISYDVKEIWGESSVKNALHSYCWQADDTYYGFDVDPVGAYSVIFSGLNGYDAFIIPGVPRQYALTGWKYSMFNNTVHNFVSNGGGYVGFCGGANTASMGLYENNSLHTTTLWETNMDRTALGLINAYAIQDFADPYINPFEVGQAAYLHYNHNDNAWGACFDMPVNNSHTLFNGYNNSNRTIRWGGGPAFHIPQGADVDVLASYPPQCFPSPGVSIWEVDTPTPAFSDFWEYFLFCHLTDRYVPC